MVHRAGDEAGDLAFFQLATQRLGFSARRHIAGAKAVNDAFFSAEIGAHDAVRKATEQILGGGANFVPAKSRTLLVTVGPELYHVGPGAGRLIGLLGGIGNRGRGGQSPDQGNCQAGRP